MSLKIAVIVGSTRPARAGRIIADWFINEVKDTPDVAFDLIDLEEENLPFLNEPESAMTGNYTQDTTKTWSAKIAQYDGFVFVTPEYNHGYSAPLKNALDLLNAEWKHKPVAFVGYGVLGAARSIEQLAPVAAQLNMVPLTSVTVNVIEIWAAFNEDGTPNPANFKGASAEAVVSNLTWWAKALKVAREA